MEMGAELMFQIIADRAEKAALIVTTNLPFSEWGQVFPNLRLSGAVLDLRISVKMNSLTGRI